MTIRLSKHARQRAAEMGIPTKRIKRAFAEGSQCHDYPSRDETYPGCRIRVLGDIAVAYNPKTNIVITVLWNGYFVREVTP